MALEIIAVAPKDCLGPAHIEQAIRENIFSKIIFGLYDQVYKDEIDFAPILRVTQPNFPDDDVKELAEDLLDEWEYIPEFLINYLLIFKGEELIRTMRKIEPDWRFEFGEATVILLRRHHDTIMLQQILGNDEYEALAVRLATHSFGRGLIGLDAQLWGHP